MKKLLLTLGATAAIAAPVALVVACGSSNGSGTTPGQTGAPGTTAPTFHGNLDSSFDATKFKVSEVTEDAHVQQFEQVAPVGTIQTFKVFDNGLFKVKVSKDLIGTGKYFADDSKAALEAKYIAQTINYGPAITHLEKGIQFIKSDSPASLGGNLGVQIAVSNNSGSADDEGLYNETSLVDHEYGHHETMWDFQNIVGGSLDKAPLDTNTMGGTLVKDLIADGYQDIADVAKTYVSGKDPDWNWIYTDTSDVPSDYGLTVHRQHSIFPHTNYPFDASELTTRLLNILSCRTNLNAQELYEGHAGGYIGNTLSGMDVPAAFVSDMTYRHHAGDSVFGNGKDKSRVTALINSYMNDIFGLGKGKLHLLGDHNKVTGINMSGFGIGAMTKMEVQDQTGKVIQTIPVDTYSSRFGFKDELVSDHWATQRSDLVQSLNDVPVDLDITGGKTYKLVGKDDANNVVDLSKLKLSIMSASDNSYSQIGFNGIKSESNFLTISQ